METKIIDKIRKLLALGESPNEAEAAAAVAKAHELLKQNNLTIESISEKKGIEGTICRLMKKQKTWEVLLMVSCANHCYCTMVTHRYKNGRKTEWEIFGRPDNVKTALWFYDYLSQTIKRISKEQCPGSHRDSFRHGMVARIELKFRLEREKENTATNALVLVTKEAERARDEKYQDIKCANHKVKNDDASSAGFHAAGGISLNRQINKGGN